MASGGGGGHQNTTKDIGAPLSLSVIKIVKYCGVWGGDALGGGGKILQKIMVPCLSVIKIVKCCGAGGGGGALGGAKILQKIMAPPLCHCDN